MNPAAARIREEIEKSGPMTFARFMELALYGPGIGYYERRRTIGRAGDFYTSVSVGPLFGELLAAQFAQWMDQICPSGQVQWVEAGAHDGRLAADVLGWLHARRPDLLERLEYVLIEPSETRRQWQRETLADWPQAQWVEEMPAVTGLIFSNEFLDALPAHRLAWDRREQRWREWRVGVEGGRLAWFLEDAVISPAMDASLAAVLPDGFVVEACPAATHWWHMAGLKLRRGKLLTIDYGLKRDERFRPEHRDGTLRAYARHHSSGDLLDAPGEQDLTAEVDFSALEQAGAECGLATEGLISQAKFLTEILAADPPRDWDAKRVRQFQTLTHPEHLGRKFRVFIQGRLSAAR